MMQSNMINAVVTMTTDINARHFSNKSSNCTWNTTSVKNNVVDQEIIIEEKILKEMAKTIHIELIKHKNETTHKNE